MKIVTKFPTGLTTIKGVIKNIFWKFSNDPFRITVNQNLSKARTYYIGEMQNRVFNLGKSGRRKTAKLSRVSALLALISKVKFAIRHTNTTTYLHIRYIIYRNMHRVCVCVCLLKLCCAIREVCMCDWRDATRHFAPAIQLPLRSTPS